MKNIFKKLLLTSLSTFFSIESCFTEEIDTSKETVEIEENYFNNAHKEGAIMFNPPEGWHIADPKALPPSVKLMVVGKGNSIFPPSINLGIEKYNGDLKSYLKMIKSINESQGSEWKDLGTIKTQAGIASLSQIDAKTEWGVVRMMHVILLEDETNTVYILTAAALKEEFSKHYKDFFKSMKSLRFNTNESNTTSDTKKAIL